MNCRNNNPEICVPAAPGLCVTGCRQVLSSKHHVKYALMNEGPLVVRISWNPHLDAYSCKELMTACMAARQLPRISDDPEDPALRGPYDNVAHPCSAQPSDASHAVLLIGWKQVNGVSSWVLLNT